MILLNRPYQGYRADTIVQLPTSTEAALVAQGFGVISDVGPVTPGDVNAGNLNQGRVGVLTGQDSVTVQNSNVTSESKVFACVSQITPDATFTNVTAIACSNGSFTIYGPAAATADTSVDWFLATPTGLTTTN